jgi:PIN domain nuclease of toxin-antitoxin system
LIKLKSCSMPRCVPCGKKSWLANCIGGDARLKNAVSASQIFADFNQKIGVSVCQLPMAVVMNSALRVKWTRDPGDRIIVANAIANNEAPLVASDRWIIEQYPSAIW